MPLKRTPRDRRGEATDYTQDWLKNRETKWAEHDAHNIEAKSKAQQLADQHLWNRQRAWSDWHANENERVAERDGWPSALDQAKAATAGEQEQQRQTDLDAASHPEHLQQRRAEREQQAAQERNDGVAAATAGAAGMGDMNGRPS